MLPIPYPAETLTALNRFVSNGKKTVHRWQTPFSLDIY